VRRIEKLTFNFKNHGIRAIAKFLLTSQQLNY